MQVIIGLIIMVAFVFPLRSMAESSNTVEYTGTLIELPCTVNPDNENVYIDFGDNVNTKDLYTGQRGAYSDREFEFYLEDCDSSLADTISAKFTGNATNNGLLKFSPTSEASGVVIGLETMSGKPLPINSAKVEPVYPLNDGKITIRLRAYLKAEENAIVNKSINPGIFWATMTYTLVYE